MTHIPGLPSPQREIRIGLPIGLDISSWLMAAVGAAFPDATVSGAEREMVFNLGETWDHTAKVPAPTEDRIDALITSFKDGSFGMSAGDWFGRLMIGVALQLVGDATNYVEMTLVHPDDAPDQRWTILVQRPSGLSPHQLREAAESRADAAEARTADLEARLEEALARAEQAEARLAEAGTAVADGS